MRPVVRALLAVGALLVVVTARRAESQVVRGTVTQETSGAALPGVLVELHAAVGGERVASALTDAAGAFALGSPLPGRFVVSAKRIGVGRFTSDTLQLAAGETRVLAIVLAPVRLQLPVVVITARAPCAVVPGEQPRVAALWDEARTALEAAQISLRDRLFTAQVSRYVRELDPRSRRVLRESRSNVRGLVAAPFSSLPPESLSTLGYWQVAPDGETRYYGPDPSVLLSDHFLADHCFRLATGRGSREGMVGLAFTPVAGRAVPHLVGTVWLDARSWELRLVEFAYDRVRDGVDASVVGGEVHFARLPGGAWLVRRWHLRVPRLGRSAQPVGTEGGVPWTLVRPSGSHLAEEGGEVTTDAQRSPARPGRVTGVVRDSSGKSVLSGAVVWLVGTSRADSTGADGRFTFDSVAPGNVRLEVQSPAYSAFGVMAAETWIDLEAGDTHRLTLTAYDARALTTRLCDGRAAPWGRGTLHVVLRDSVTGTPLANRVASLRWMSTMARAPGDSSEVRAELRTSPRGSVTFCEVPSGRPLTLEVTRPDGGRPAVHRTSVEPRQVQHVELRLPPGPGGA